MRSFDVGLAPSDDALRQASSHAAPLVSRTRTDEALRFRTKVVGPDDAAVLGDLLEQIDTTYFRPHEMTADGADRIAGLHGRDVYLIGFADGEPVAYGMLRGWDEGYPIPSLGVAVRHDRVRKGYGRAMMLALHRVVRESGSDRVRLRVNLSNVAAFFLYRSLGYRPGGFERGELVMHLDL
jgi:ribosomal protein S18 acetylase RimI-like enzyme